MSGLTKKQIEEGWIEWTLMDGATPNNNGGSRRVEYKMRSDKGTYVDYVDELRWDEYGCSTVVMYRDLPEVRLKADTEEYDMSAEELDKAIKAIKSDGGSSSYYCIPLPDAIIDRIIETRSIETEDFIKYGLNNDFDLGNVVKCAVRIASNQRGAGKEGASVEYDANKIQYSANKVKRYDKV